METYRNFINGKWVESASSKTVNNINPANTDDVIGTVKQATRDEARAAVEAAAEAFPSWRSTPAPARGKIVAKAARLMEEAKEELAQILTREEGKTISESRGELQRSINVAEFCGGDPDMEDCACAGRRQHGRLQTGNTDAGHGRSHRADIR